MGTVINISDLRAISTEKSARKKIVLLGGCFDIIHKGHIEFLKNARKLGDVLVILLESDKKIQLTKGHGRPINDQNARANILSHINSVGYVIKLPFFNSDEEYEKLVKRLEPDIIAVTSGTHVFEWEKDYMKRSGGMIVESIKKEKNYSTTNILRDI